MITQTTALSRRTMRRIFKQNRGAASRLARELGVNVQNVYDALKGIGRSSRVAEAVQRRALELIAAEQEKAA